MNVRQRGPIIIDTLLRHGGCKFFPETIATSQTPQELNRGMWNESADDSKAARGPAQGPVQRGKSARQGAAAYGQGGQRRRAAAGVHDASGRNKGARQPSRSGGEDARYEADWQEVQGNGRPD